MFYLGTLLIAGVVYMLVYGTGCVVVSLVKGAPKNQPIFWE